VLKPVKYRTLLFYVLSTLTGWCRVAVAKKPKDKPMLNKNPVWRYVLVIGMLLLALVYALPNLYPEDPALNISATRGGTVAEQTRSQLEQSFRSANIAVKSVVLEEGQILARFNSTEDQLQAREIANQQLGANFVTALNLAPATPGWLTAIGATPMNLGLDLRGGVHFLLAVDMKAALDKNLNDMVQTFRADLREDQIRYRNVQADISRGQVQIT
jgi:preprotein translocase subunit SecD